MNKQFLNKLFQNQIEYNVKLITPNMESLFFKNDIESLEIELGKTYINYCELEENEKKQITQYLLSLRMKNIRKMIRAIKYGEDHYLTKTCVL